MSQSQAQAQVQVGYELPSGRADLSSDVDVVREDGFSFCIVDLDDTKPSDLFVDNSDWGNMFVCRVDTAKFEGDLETVQHAEKELNASIGWATHILVPALLLPLPQKDYSGLARYLCSALTKGSYAFFTQIWMRVPLTWKNSADPWLVWNKISMMCDHHPSLHAVLELTEDLPEWSTLLKWTGEPVRALIIDTSLFLTNNKGYPVLSKAHQAFVRLMLKYRVQLIISGTSSRESGFSHYVSYVEYLYSKMSEEDRDPVEAQWHDFLQVPLQPLMDNLDNSTYETFERDPTKYELYEEAVYSALTDKFKDVEETIVVMVVGAGRGPLVRRSLRAAQRASKKLKVYAVEKNPNAAITLRNIHRREGWKDTVEIVESDMRFFNPEHKADILVSELLGSFGDNELSPECLDGAQRFLKEDGISIPADYASFLGPVCSPKLYNEVKNARTNGKFETGYVVKIHNAAAVAEPKKCFYFQHPNPSLGKEKSSSEYPATNERHSILTFEASEDYTVHGFAGYFDSKLYNDVRMSIHPLTHTPKMMSWFPIFFPIRTPGVVKKGQKIKVHFWRKCTSEKVWYEWCVVAPFTTPIHNCNGMAYWIGL